MFDKVLLILLLVMLPVGIVVSRIFTGEIKVGNDLSATQQKKLEAIVDQLQKQITTAPPSRNQSSGGFSVTGTIYASESASLQIGGVAPKENSLIWINVAATKDLTTKKTATGSGESLIHPQAILASMPQAGGSFNLSVPVKNLAGIVEIRLEQASASYIIQYDLDQNKPINL